MLGNRIRTFRQERGLTLEQLADRSGISPSYLSTIERGLKKPSVPILKDIADALHVSAALLIQDEDESFNGEKLRFLREGRGLSIEELAEISELSPEILKKLEHGDIQPDFEQMERLAEALNFTVGYFLEKNNYQTGIGPRLKQLRESQGLTVASLADKAEVSAGLVSQIENNYTVPSLDTLERLADCLCTTLHYFLLPHVEIENLITQLGPDLIELLSDHKVQAVLRSVRDFNSSELRYILNYLQFFKRNRKIL
jgi:transcriptional regulator with XRE-family HTH domain